MVAGESQVLEVLYDHYKDSFSNIIAREQRRDRLFVLLILIYGALVFQIRYPTAIEALGQVSLAGVTVAVADLPLSALLDATWALALVVGLKYCQTALSVERQYPYLHRLEEVIGARLGDPDLFCREGKAYLRGYPQVLNWAWFCYVVLFPLAVLAATASAVVGMWVDLDYGVLHNLFGTVAGGALVVSFALYQVIPRFGRVVAKVREWVSK